MPCARCCPSKKQELGSFFSCSRSLVLVPSESSASPRASPGARRVPPAWHRLGMCTWRGAMGRRVGTARGPHLPCWCLAALHGQGWWRKHPRPRYTSRQDAGMTPWHALHPVPFPPRAVPPNWGPWAVVGMGRRVLRWWGPTRPRISPWGWALVLTCRKAVPWSRCCSRAASRSFTTP